MPKPFQPSEFIELDPETIEKLRTLAAARGCTPEEALRDALDRLILHETGRNN
jgi:hypothetical protein